MNKTIDCFILSGETKDNSITIETLKKCDLVNNVYVLSLSQGGMTAHTTEILHINKPYSSLCLRTIAEKSAQTPYILLYTKPTRLKLGTFALERMVQVMENNAHHAMVYSDHYLDTGHEITTAPKTDFQPGSLRDDFDFGSLVLFRGDVFRKMQALDKHEYQYAALYSLRLHALACHYHFTHINEYLYTECQTDKRASGEKQFDYVNPKHKDAQEEMEKACTRYLKDIKAYLDPIKDQAIGIDPYQDTFEIEASVIIPVRNRAGVIGDAVHSALSQKTNFPFNIIVINNHSTDNTTAVLKRLSMQNDKIVHIIPTSKDLGIGGCWNEAIFSPYCGKFAIQLDSDDVYKDEYTLQKIVDTFYRLRCAMVIGSYQLTDKTLTPLNHDVIDHKEWTDANGRNNALRINGLGAPRAFYTPTIRNIRFPNVSYGEDYAVGLALSGQYKIGRIYEVLYLCRRWDGNSDAALNIESVNKNNLYKDKIRTWELQKRIALHTPNPRLPLSVEEMRIGQELHYALAATNYNQLHYNKSQAKTLTLCDKGDKALKIQYFYNPQRINSTTAQTDKPQTQQTCVLCTQHRPQAQHHVSLGNYDICVNPYPIFKRHLTIIHKTHTPQTLNGHIYELLKIAECLDGYRILFNGGGSGASVPHHMHFQAAGKEEYINSEALTFTTLRKNKKNKIRVKKNVLTYIALTTDTKELLFNSLSKIYQQLYNIIYEGKEPLLNLALWHNPSKSNKQRLNKWYCVIYLRSKLRPDCYFDKGDNGFLISPAIAEVSGICPIVRKEDMNKITSKLITGIYKEISLGTSQVRQFNKLMLTC